MLIFCATGLSTVVQVADAPDLSDFAWKDAGRNGILSPR